MKEKLVWLKFRSMSKPVTAIKDRQRQVVIRLLPYGAEHITIHMKPDGELIRNYSLPYVAEPNWLGVITQIAKQEFKDWKKHLNYAFAKQPLRRLENDQGYHLLSKLIDLDNYLPKQKYTRSRDFEFDVKDARFMLNLYLSTVDNPITNVSARVQTTLGDICFRFEKPTMFGQGE